MMFIRFLITTAFWSNVAGSLDILKQSFIEMSSDMPLLTIENILSKQQEMIEILYAYSVLSENFQEGYYHGNQTIFQTKKKVISEEQDKIDIHNDLIFIGFPAAAIDSMREKWFEPVTREDPVMASLGSNGHIVMSPGDLKISHHFHLPQISFHVADSVKEYVTKLLIRQQEGDDSYINSWELEEILDELTDLINKTHNLDWKLSRGSDGTLFILNIDFSTSALQTSYSYRNGFSLKDLGVMAADAEVVQTVREVLDVKRPARIDLPAESEYDLFDSGNHRHKYLERFRLKSSSTKKVHWRDAVPTTRVWAESLRERTATLLQKFDLKDRALRILRAPDDSSLGFHKISLAVSLNKIITGVKTHDVSECSAATWVGGGRVMFRDLRALSNPPIHRSLGDTPSTPAPRALTEEDWMGLGLIEPSKDGVVRVGASNLRSAAAAITRHLISLTTLSEQSKCVETFLKEPIGPEAGAGEIKVNDVAVGLFNQVEEGHLDSACAGLAFQIQLIEVLNELTEQVRMMAEKWELSMQSDEVKIHLDDAAGFQSRILEEALEISNPLLSSKSTQLHAGRLSEQAAVYLAHLTSYALQSARYRVTPPIALRLDLSEGFHEHQQADSLEGGLSTSSLTPVTDALRKRVEETSRALEEYGIDQDIESAALPRSHHVYTGESLLEIVLADHSYNYHNEDMILSGAHSRNEHKASSDVRSLPVWKSLLPSILIPSKINVVIYIITLQSSYDSKGKTVGDNSGFDLTTFTSELTRLKLPSQHMTVSTVVVDKISIMGEKGIGLGLSSCKREGVIPGIKSFRPSFYQFYDESCLWSHLHPYDEKNILENKLKVDEKKSSQTQYVPIFLVSLNSPIPIFLAGLQQASVVGDMVVVIQNNQELIEAGVSCYAKNSKGKKLDVNQGTSGRNPLSAALAAAAQAIGGLAPGQSGHKGVPTSPSLSAALRNTLTDEEEEEDSTFGYSKWSVDRHSRMRSGSSVNKDSSSAPGLLLRDYSSYLGESPMFQASGLYGTSLPRFSNLELDSMHRSRVLRSLGVTRAIKANVVKNMLGVQDKPMESEIYQISKLVSQALAALDASDWPAAASYSNTAHVKTCELHSTFFSHVHDLTVTAATTNIDSHNKTYIKEAILKNLVEEIDLNDEDSFMYFYTKFIIVCAVLFITAFNSVKSVVKKYRRRSLLGV